MDSNFAYHQSVIQKFGTHRQRIKYLLENITELRDLDDWDFYWEYVHYYQGFSPGMQFDNLWKVQLKRNANFDSVNRSLELVRHDEYVLAKEFVNAIRKHEERSPLWWSGIYELRKFLKSCKYIATNPDLLLKKIVKQNAILEAVCLV